MIPGTTGYAERASELVARYESISFCAKHKAILHLLPTVPSSIIDIGAASGTDAAWLAAHGHQVVAVEPVDEFRLAGIALHPTSAIEWINDSLPTLAQLSHCDRQFDVVLISAVWMHLDATERTLAMQSVASLIASTGTFIMSLRHGPLPTDRRMFDVSSEATISLAHTCGLRPIFNARAQSIQAANRTAGVTWTHLAFQRDHSAR